MKKIIIIMLLLFASKQIALAQQIISTLTQLTTDLMRTENRNNFSWRTVQYSRLNVHQSIKNYFDIMVDDGDGGTGGGNNGGGSNCYCVDRGFSIGMEEVYANGMILWCHKCSAGGTDCNGTLCGELSGNSPPSSGSNPPPPANNNPFNWGVGGTWGSLPWGNLGGIYTGGFLYPPTSVPPASYGGGSNGGGGSAPPSSTSVPPPTNLASAVDNKKPDCAGVIGGSAYRDSCKTCVGGTTKKQPCKKDCAGVWGGTAAKDSCNNCRGGTTGRKPCVKDCMGIWGGTAAKDSCQKCAGGTSGVIACNKIPCQTDSTMKVTRDMLNKLGERKTFKNSADSIRYNKNLDSLPKYINLLAKDFGIDNRDALACFLAIAAQETDNFTNFVEDSSFTKGSIQANFGAKLFPDTIVNKYVKCLCVLDRAYAGDCDTKLHTNCDEASKDGSKYRGRGLFHLTHRDSYWRFALYYQPKYNDYFINFETTPNLLETNYKFAVMSAMWEMCVDKSKTANGKDKPLKSNALLQALAGNFDGVINQINLYDTNRKGKKHKLDIIKKLLCL